MKSSFSLVDVFGDPFENLVLLVSGHGVPQLLTVGFNDGVKGLLVGWMDWAVTEYVQFSFHGVKLVPPGLTQTEVIGPACEVSGRVDVGFSDDLSHSWPCLFEMDCFLLRRYMSVDAYS